MAYDTTEAVAKFLSGFQMKITNRERDTVAPDYYVKYLLTLSKGGKDFSTTFVSDPRAFGEPTVTQVFSALADDALTLRKYSTDEFVDKLYAQGVKPSAALRAYDSCKETNLWMQDELYLSGWEIEEISKTLTKHEDEVNTLVEKAASERAARYAYDLAKVNAFLKETCKEVFGILPGADDGGYSLSGEAKEAALSRFALPENRKAALNMIRKLNESRDSNDNAL